MASRSLTSCVALIARITILVARCGFASGYRSGAAWCDKPGHGSQVGGSGSYGLSIGSERAPGSTLSVTLYDNTDAASFQGFLVMPSAGYFSSFSDGKAKTCEERSAWTHSDSSDKSSVSAALTLGEVGTTTLTYYVVISYSFYHGPLTFDIEVQEVVASLSPTTIIPTGVTQSPSSNPSTVSPTTFTPSSVPTATISPPSTPPVTLSPTLSTSSWSPTTSFPSVTASTASPAATSATTSTPSTAPATLVPTATSHLPTSSPSLTSPTSSTPTFAGYIDGGGVVVLAVIEFQHLDIQAFNNGTFKTDFETGFRLSLAESAGCNQGDVLIHRIEAGSVQVNSTVTLVEADEQAAAGELVSRLKTDISSIFTSNEFQSYGALNASNVSVDIFYPPPPPPIPSASLPSPSPPPLPPTTSPGRHEADSDDADFSKTKTTVIASSVAIFVFFCSLGVALVKTQRLAQYMQHHSNSEMERTLHTSTINCSNLSDASNRQDGSIINPLAHSRSKNNHG